MPRRRGDRPAGSRRSPRGRSLTVVRSLGAVTPGAIIPGVGEARNGLNRFEDRLIAGAPAEMPAQRVADGDLGGPWLIAQQGVSAHEDTRCAEAALEGVVIDKGLLER